ncbi:MAG: cupin [Gemmatimonadetes bacterium]|nr:cupin [Gemmatimonadota bacterium]
MKRLVWYVALIAQPFLWDPPFVRSGVYAWSGFKQTATTDGRIDRPILNGSTTELSYLDVHATTIPARSTVTFVHDTTELLMIARDGSLRVTLGGVSKVVGHGSVAVALPGDALEIGNAGELPATYYLFTYKSKTPTDVARGRTAGGSVLVDWNDMKKTASANGGQRQPFDRATAMFKRFEMHVSTLNAGATNHAPHTHGAEEFVLMLEGNVSMFIEGNSYPSTPGDLIFLAANVPHSLNNLKEGQAEYFAFQGQAR